VAKLGIGDSYQTGLGGEPQGGPVGGREVAQDALPGRGSFNGPAGQAPSGGIFQKGVRCAYPLGGCGGGGVPKALCQSVAVDNAPYWAQALGMGPKNTFIE